MLILCSFYVTLCHFMSFYVTFASLSPLLPPLYPIIPHQSPLIFFHRMADASPRVTTLSSATPPHPPNSSGSAKAPAKTNATPPTHSLLSCQLYLFPLANHPSRLKLSRKTPSQSPSWKHSAAAWLRDRACSPQPATAMWAEAAVVVRMI